MTKDEKWLLEEKYRGVVTPLFETDCERLAKGEPLAYVIGSQPFLGLSIHLDSHPLIPRVETEWWAEQLFNTVIVPKSGMPAKLKFLDLCAGSGAIGCGALAKLLHAEIYFGELNRAHKTTILKNIRENNLDETRAHVCIGDLFEPFRATNFSCPYSDLEKWKYSCGDMTFDIIAANPPYIPSGCTLDTSVVDYEPHQALFSGADGLELICRIARELPPHLNPGGQAWIEVDSTHAAAACALFTDQGISASIRTDQYDKPRIVVVSFS